MYLWKSKVKTDKVPSNLQEKSCIVTAAVFHLSLLYIIHSQHTSLRRLTVPGRFENRSNCYFSRLLHTQTPLKNLHSHLFVLVWMFCWDIRWVLCCSGSSEKHVWKINKIMEHEKLYSAYRSAWQLLQRQGIKHCSLWSLGPLTGQNYKRISKALIFVKYNWSTVSALVLKSLKNNVGTVEHYVFYQWCQNVSPSQKNK